MDPIHVFASLADQASNLKKTVIPVPSRDPGNDRGNDAVAFDAGEAELLFVEMDFESSHRRKILRATGHHAFVMNR